MKKTAILGVLAISAFFFCGAIEAQQEPPGQSAAEQAQEEDEAFTVETVSGEVAGITSQSISIIYDRDYDAATEYEMILPYDQNLKVRHKKDLKQIKRGDLISVEYEKPAEGSKKKARAVTVNFIQSGIDSLMADAPAEEPASGS